VFRLRASLLLLLLLSGHLLAQEMDPRRWSRLPNDVSFIGFGLGNTTGDILFDPVLKLEDVTLDYTVLGASFIHTFAFYNKPARIDVTVPYANGHWEGLLNGEPASVTRRGFVDPTIRLSLNLYGAPVLKGKEFGQFMAAHPVSTMVSAAIATTVPVGEYFQDKLINLGGNRWILQPQLGVLHQRNKWQFEATAALGLYGNNREFYPGTQVREQDPLWSLQAHIIHTFRPGLWASVSGGYAWGAQSTIGGVSKNDENRYAGWALSFGLPITPRQGLKFAFIRSRTQTNTGSKLDSFSMAWSMMFGH
jgi:hypothetical protein